MGKDKKKKDYSAFRHFIFVCHGGDCKDCGSKDIQKSISQALKENGLNDVSKIIKINCTGRCKEAPVVIAKEKWMGNLNKESAPREVLKLIGESY